MANANLISNDEFYDPSVAKSLGINPATCIVIGGGQRGYGYSLYAKDFPHLLNIVGVADPLLHVQQKFKKVFHLNKKQVFSDWKDLLKFDKLADFVMVCTPDRLHKDPAIAMANKGYHILLEKPLATCKEDCMEIVEACKSNNVMLCVCHVLRYFPPNVKIDDLIKSGIIGDVVNIQHLEPVGFYHFAHSYVRGNWRNESGSSFSLLAKSCHDIDLICHWMNRKCLSVSSFGSLNHFKPENKPFGGGQRCLDCKVEKDCCYSAVKIYLNRAKKGYYGWPVSVVTDIEDLGVLTKKIKSGPYGRCVYHCDNDVCDNQVVNMEFEGGKTASFTMIAFTEKLCARETKVFGTKGQITYNGGNVVYCYDFLSQKTTPHICYPSSSVKSSLGGHQGADFHLIDAFMKGIIFKNKSLLQSGPDDALYSYQVVFAAEKSRLSRQTLHWQENGTWENLHAK